MNLTNKRCGECGEKSYQLMTISGQWQKVWKDYPSVFLTQNLELWVCTSCKSHAITPGDATKIDKAIEASIRDQTRQFLVRIKEQTKLNYGEIARRLGYKPSYISSLKKMNLTPAFKLWNQLKAVTFDPKGEMERLNPDLDIIAANLLLRVK